MDQYLGQILLFAGNFAPRGWAYCNGQLLAISQNDALFSLLGTTYGGDGRTTFALPDLRGRAPIHSGTGPGLTTRIAGQRSGTQTNTLTVNQMPSHNHIATVNALQGPLTIRAVEDDANTDEPTNNFLAIPNVQGSNQIYSTDQVNTSLGTVVTPVPQTEFSIDTVTIHNQGGGQPFNNMQPFLGVHYIIALIGEYPSRS